MPNPVAGSPRSISLRIFLPVAGLFSLVGQAVVTSAEGIPFVYQDGVVTNLNNWLRSEVIDSGYTITEAKGINDRGQIIAQGTYDDSDRGFLLNPTFREINRNINVGNISTLGETVLLEGAEVYLEGKSIVTQGGNITFDGETKVNHNLIIDTSVIEEEVITDGGDITFTKTLDAASAGSQNLTTKAGTSNILFSDVVGGENTFFDITVEGAESVTVNNDLAVDGNLDLEVIDNITTASITAAGLVNISLGKVGDEIYPSTGNVTTGNIDALGIEVLNNGNFTAGDLTTASEAEFELAQRFTPNQRDEIIKFVNISTYRLDFEDVEEKGRFDTQNETGCFAIPLEFHLGNDRYHNQYADDVTGSRGDLIVIPLSRIGAFASTTYDGIVRAGSKATLLSLPQIPQRIGDLAEVKTGYRGLNRIVNENAFADDLESYNSLVNQVIKEATIARACQKEYFISFDIRSVANSARQLLNTDPRILALGLTIKVNHIVSRPLLR